MEKVEQNHPMSEPAAAQYVGCSGALLRLKRRQQNGPRYYRVGKLVRYRQADLDQWITANSHGDLSSTTNKS
jgi:predicted DNA-binding transcriptional regulator AlpA